MSQFLEIFWYFLNTVISRYLEHRYLKVSSYTKEYILDNITAFIYLSTPVFWNYSHLKVNFLESENLL